jgi:putative transcriptional regulator
MQIETRAQEIIASVGGRIRKARTAAGMTQEALASRAEVSISTLSKIETGTSIPTLDVFCRISLVLDQTPDLLTGWRGPKITSEARKRMSLIEEAGAALASLPHDQLRALVALLKR